MPAFLELTFPMAVLLGVLMGFGRMSSDQEMTAARACGISLYRLAIPVMLVALGVYAVSSYFAFSLAPVGEFQSAQTSSTSSPRPALDRRLEGKNLRQQFPRPGASTSTTSHDNDSA